MNPFCSLSRCDKISGMCSLVVTVLERRLHDVNKGKSSSLKTSWSSPSPFSVPTNLLTIYARNTLHDLAMSELLSFLTTHGDQFRRYVKLSQLQAITRQLFKHTSNNAAELDSQPYTPTFIPKRHSTPTATPPTSQPGKMASRPLRAMAFYPRKARRAIC